MVNFLGSKPWTIYPALSEQIIINIFKEGKNTDVVVRGQNPLKSWHAHKCILSSASEYLR